MNRDFAEMLDALSVARADSLIVGAYALAAHGRPRATGALDLWVRPTADNAQRVWSARVSFGATKGVVFQIGVEPARIDILTAVTALEFDDA